MHRYFYDRPALHAEFKAQHSGFWGTLRKINAVVGTAGAVLGTVAAVKHTADVLTGKAPALPRPHPYPSYRLHSWGMLPSLHHHFYERMVASSMRHLDLGIRRWRTHHRPPLAMSMARNRHEHS